MSSQDKPGVEFEDFSVNGMIRTFDDDLNVDRTRWHGLRTGDRIEQKAFGRTLSGIVLELDPLDNNCVHVLIDGRDDSMRMVAEWCDVVEKRP